MHVYNLRMNKKTRINSSFKRTFVTIASVKHDGEQKLPVAD